MQLELSVQEEPPVGCPCRFQQHRCSLDAPFHPQVLIYAKRLFNAVSEEDLKCTAGENATVKDEDTEDLCGMFFTCSRNNDRGDTYGVVIRVSIRP